MQVIIPRHSLEFTITNVKEHYEREEVNLLSHFLNYANAVYHFFFLET